MKITIESGFELSSEALKMARRTKMNAYILIVIPQNVLTRKNKHLIISQKQINKHVLPRCKQCSEVPEKQICPYPLALPPLHLLSAVKLRNLLRTRS